MSNPEIAAAFEELAALLELAGENPFKTRAYRAFAETVRGLDGPVAQRVAQNQLIEMDGVGKAIAGKVDELLAKGTFDALERARQAVPPSLVGLLRVPGLGTKTARTLWQSAGITSLAELVAACREHRLTTLPGFGAKREAKFLEGATRLLARTDSSEGQGR
jgi:DNA polymerase (family 10)